MKLAHAILLAAGACIALAACEMRHLAQYKDLDPTGWDRSHTLTYDAPCEGECYTTLHVRTTHAYPYTNLALEVRQDTLLCDTVIIHIAHPEGTQLQHSCAPLPHTIVGGEGCAAVRIRSILNEEVLTGVASVGLD